MTQVEHETTALTVQGALDALQRQRDKEWDPERITSNAELRRSLEENADRDRFVKAGDVVEPFTLVEVGGARVVLSDLLATGPVVLIFFRFESCPACNVALPAYQQALAPALRDLGAHLVAVSPQAPELLVEMKRRYGFDFLVASDSDGILVERFGIGFSPDEQARAQARRAGSDLGVVLGTGRWELPYPTAVVIDRDGIVRFADVHPDWMVRTEAATIIDAVRKLS